MAANEPELRSRRREPPRALPLAERIAFVTPRRRAPGKVRIRRPQVEPGQAGDRPDLNRGAVERLQVLVGSTALQTTVTLFTPSGTPETPKVRFRSSTVRRGDVVRLL